MPVQDQQPLRPHPVLGAYYPSAEQRRQRVDAMFDNSAPHYDWITKVMSFGSGQWYRRQALQRSGVDAGMRVLDVGAGTGGVSLLAQEIVGANGLVVAHDPSAGMLGEASRQGVRHAVQGLGEQLSYPDNSFDRVTMGYALRHVADLRVLFTEYARVLKPGGKVLLLEITRPEHVVSRGLLRVYLRGIVPLVTRLARRSAPAQELMRYYWDTIEHCVPPATILEAMAAAGLAGPDRRVELGIFSEYSASKPARSQTGGEQ
jgi:demethylmenaquinone methyltransferase/2-methoxy-6-polyprenyl-1,4-benzoquinol methylase